jgi:voltage-gated potassium channel
MRILRLYLQVASRWRWGLLLVLILATLLVEPFLGQGPGPELLTRILFALIVLGAMVAGRVPARARHANFVILGIWLVLVLLHFAGRPYPQAMAFSALVLLFGVIYITFHFLITHRESNVDAMVGAAAGYFLLALAWAVLFIQIENRTPGSFGLDTAGDPGGQLIYFSLVTVTTLGFGDIVPVSAPARILTAIAAASGTLYIAILIGSIVGRFPRPPDRGAADPPTQEETDDGP